MKKIFYSFIVIAALSLVGCSGDNDPNDGRFFDDPESGWVTFNLGSIAEPLPNFAYGIAGCEVESRQIIVPLLLDAPTNKDGLQVEYTITDFEGTSEGVISHSGYAVFPKGSLEGTITIDYPETIESSIGFVITLTETSRNNVVIGHPDDTEPVTYIVRINKGNRDSLLGISEDTFVELEEEDELTYLISQGAASNEIIISNISKLFTDDSVSETRVFINEDGTISGPDFSENFLYFNGDVAADFYVGDIEGTYDACEGVIDLSFKLRFGTTTTGVQNVVLNRIYPN
ncbi:hypothetical protein DVK85_00840 [Flavobacterium arcticum]|uniref:Uncharacterized protein n=1 Tax=Flavobacterium arcticum TaxID=1784713 RepID=A0A345H8E3_9FLAO|nr:hypothetical protein [Flavobacterium arcticum]AXG72853.1 hypothetical protein DVK85_00840 [Flavobacterium arcticum]KAF2510482.1 hypothetical protein E0W72_08365 [Flavobacterium arcticum]